MVKNGLFLCSIGLLIILFSVNPNSLKYDIFSLVSGIALVSTGLFFFLKGSKAEKKGEKNGNY